MLGVQTWKPYCPRRLPHSGLNLASICPGVLNLASICPSVPQSAPASLNLPLRGKDREMRRPIQGRIQGRGCGFGDGSKEAGAD